jgi:large subunit ribosomal protein L25
MSVVATFKAESRNKLGSSESRRIRNLGKIPAVFYSKDGNINFSINFREFQQEYSKGNILTSVVEIELEGKKIKAIAHKVELDPVSDQPIHIDFLKCEDSKLVRAKPKLKFINQDKSPGLKKGGFLNIVLRKVEIFCEDIKLIPAVIEVDVGSLHVGNKLRANDLKLPNKTKLTTKNNFLIASLTGRGKSEEEVAVATPAAGTTTAATAAPKAEEKKQTEGKK